MQTYKTYKNSDVYSNCGCHGNTVKLYITPENSKLL